MHVKRDILVELIILRYTQLSSICFTLKGQTNRIGAG